MAWQIAFVFQIQVYVAIAVVFKIFKKNNEHEDIYVNWLYYRAKIVCFMYDYDQQQALEWPSLDIPLCWRWLCEEVFRLFVCLFCFSLSRHLFYCPFFCCFFICAICCVWSCFVQSCQYHLTFLELKTSQYLGQSLPLRPLYRLSFFLICFSFLPRRK